MPFNIARWVDDVLSETAGEPMSAPVLAKIPVPISPRTIRKSRCSNGDGSSKPQPCTMSQEEAQWVEKDPVLSAFRESQEMKRKRSAELSDLPSQKAVKRQRKASQVVHDHGNKNNREDDKHAHGSNDAESYEYSIGDSEGEEDDGDDISSEQMEIVQERIIEMLETWTKMMVPALLKNVEGDQKEAILRDLERVTTKG
ncbi:hypothetical protein K431DRAFT_285829 [Polychaeton citri CBS 116435]|uniref:Uncharacterized protein n=1 Tax=Polychaeton citri CBS 116435 TaxID=1314669 RepID=A0A9P4UP13_9PEZI|nr:hypothetical protein K431DRAFT_285829 [Polychaeton citri CBS 116435]